MWLIRKNLIMIADWKSCGNDQLTVKLCMFRGPNYIIWEHFQPGQFISQMVKNGDKVDVVFYDGNGNEAITIACVVDYIDWNNSLQCMTVKLIPDLFKLVNIPCFFGDTSTKNIKNILNNFCGKDVTISIESSLENKELYNGSYIYGRLIDYIANFAYKHDREFYINDYAIYIGYVIDDMTVNDAFELNFIDNTLYVYEINGKRIVCGTTNDAPFQPGITIKIQNRLNRIAYVKTRYYKSAVETTYYCTELGTKLTEYDILCLLDEIDKGPLSIAMVETYNQLSSTIVGKINEDDGYEQSVEFLTDSRDMRNIITKPQSFPIHTVRSTPYAGEEVGIQFPNNKNAYGISVAVEGDMSSMVEIGQIYQKKMPKRDSEEDFRLTLPDGGTLYYKKSTGEWILAAKNKIRIITKSDISNESVPTEGDIPIARKDDETIIDSNTDADYVTWVNSVKKFLIAWLSALNLIKAPPDPSGAATVSYANAMGIAVEDLLNPPSSLKGKINTGSETLFTN